MLNNSSMANLAFEGAGLSKGELVENASNFLRRIAATIEVRTPASCRLLLREGRREGRTLITAT